MMTFIWTSLGVATVATAITCHTGILNYRSKCGMGDYNRVVPDDGSYGPVGEEKDYVACLTVVTIGGDGCDFRMGRGIGVEVAENGTLRMSYLMGGDKDPGESPRLWTYFSSIMEDEGDYCTSWSSFQSEYEADPSICTECDTDLCNDVQAAPEFEDYYQGDSGASQGASTKPLYFFAFFCIFFVKF